MDEKELQKKLDVIKKEYKIFEKVNGYDYKNGKCYISERHAKFNRDLKEVFETIKWQLKFNKYKELKYDDKSKPIETRGCGTPVRVRSCREEHGNKTYFGILLGSMALSIGHSIDLDGNVTASYSSYNPAIFIPELNDIIYGCESWWGEIENEKELKELITDEVIGNVWYVKLLSNLGQK